MRRDFDKQAYQSDKAKVSSDKVIGNENARLWMEFLLCARPIYPLLRGFVNDIYNSDDRWLLTKSGMVGLTAFFSNHSCDAIISLIRIYLVHLYFMRFIDSFARIWPCAHITASLITRWTDVINYDTRSTGTCKHSYFVREKKKTRE